MRKAILNERARSEDRKKDNAPFEDQGKRRQRVLRFAETRSKNVKSLNTEGTEEARRSQRRIPSTAKLAVPQSGG